MPIDDVTFVFWFPRPSSSPMTHRLTKVRALVWGWSLTTWVWWGFLRTKEFLSVSRQKIVLLCMLLIMTFTYCLFLVTKSKYTILFSKHIFSRLHLSRDLNRHCFHLQSPWSFPPRLWTCTIFVLTSPRPAPCNLHPRYYHRDFLSCRQYPQQWPNCHPTSWSTDSGKCFVKMHWNVNIKYLRYSKFNSSSLWAHHLSHVISTINWK